VESKYIKKINNNFRYDGFQPPRMKSPYIALLESVFLLDSYTLSALSSNPPCHSKEAKRKKDIRFILKMHSLGLHIVFSSFLISIKVFIQINPLIQP